MNETVTVTDVLLGNIGKLENIRIPAKEIAAIRAINEVAHDLRVCVEAIAKANSQAANEAKEQQSEHGEEVPQDEADPQ